MRRPLSYAECQWIHEAVAAALNRARVVAQERVSHAGAEIEAADWEVADAARRWGVALREELSPGPHDDDVTGEHVRLPFPLDTEQLLDERAGA